MDSENSFNEILKGGNLKSTKHRIAVLEILKANKLPLSAEDIYIRLKQNNTSISLSTVYRVLETLHEKDIVSKVSIPDSSRAVYELHGNEHRHHLLCVKCKKLLAIDGCPLEEYEKLLEDRFGFTVKGHNLEVYGYCKSCTGY
jgi:Fur family ferric uptake transcriptional regulator